MAGTLLSLLMVGDSHVARYGPASCVPDDPSLAGTQILLESAYILGAYGVSELIVTYGDGRKALNPLLEHTLSKWPGLNVKGQASDSAIAVRKHLLLSTGTSLHVCDPAMSVSDRTTHRLFFRGGVDFILPDHAGLPVDGGCVLLPVALIQDLFMSMIAPLRDALALIEPRYRSRLWIVGSPPPPADNTLKQARVLSKFASGCGDEVFLAQPLVALKTWLLVNKLVAGICAENNCRFLDCAPVACDENGFLRKEFEHDGFHANAAYNERMTQHIFSKVLESEFSAGIEGARS